MAGDVKAGVVEDKKGLSRKREAIYGSNRIHSYNMLKLSRKR